MQFEQFYLGCLAHASYLLGSDGVAAVVDPQRDVDLYIHEAAERGLAIRYIVETHLHADFVSGHVELARRSGAEICLGRLSRARFPHRPVSDGDELALGRCRLRFLETPGHTPESICVLVTDPERGPEPFAALTGDTLFIGDVGRPDLSNEYSVEQLASMLYDSLHSKLLTLPDGLEVYPAHGAGSLCGRQIGAERHSTIGIERLTNYACRPMSREQFVQLVTADLPARPGYFAHDVELNRSGAPPLAELPPLEPLDPPEFARRQAAGAVVLDTRPPVQFAAGHVPGAVHIALSGQYAAWAATLIGLDADILLVAEDDAALSESRTRLARVGIERVAGYLRDGIVAWDRAGFPLASVAQVTATELRRMLDDHVDFLILDLRRPAENRQGAIDGALLRPLDCLLADLNGLSRNTPLIVHCASGYRSSIGASLLLRAGFTNAINLIGGYEAWRQLTMVSDASTATVA